MLEIAEEVALQLRNELSAAARPKVQGRHDDDLIDIERLFAEPHTAQGEFPLYGGQTCKPGKQSLFDSVEALALDRGDRR